MNYNPPVTADFLRGAAFHEAGHVVVARFLGLTVGKIEIGDDGSGNTKIGSAKHLPLIDQIALCVAGIEAEALFNVPEFKHAAFSITKGSASFWKGLLLTKALNVETPPTGALSKF